jgi:S-adenosylmethionine-diacylglycerol 3-amino-3-carboxypropyl transferase
LENIVNREELMKNITAYSLSDFWSYADDSNYSWIWKNIVKYSRNDAKFCERQFLVKRKPDFFSKWIQRDQDLEKKLYTEDNTVFYTFCAWKINNTH